MKRRMDFIMKKIGDENLLVPLGKQMSRLNGIITLNETAAYLWELLSEEHSPEELSIALAKKFDITSVIACVDVQTFLDEISNLKLLET